MDAPVLNSVSISGTSATINVTPPVDASYNHTRILYRKYGGSTFTTGVSYSGTQGVAGNTTQTGLEDGVLYQFATVAGDSSNRYSLPSNMITAYDDSAISETNLFIENMVTLISNCNNFQDWTSTTTAENAALRIFNRQYDIINDQLHFPFAVVGDVNGILGERIDIDKVISNMEISVSFIDECDSSEKRNDSEIIIDFMATTEKIVRDMFALQSKDSFLIISSYRNSKPPYFGGLTEDETNLTQDFVITEYTFTCGA